MSYVIERDVPLPRGSGLPAPSGPRTAWTKVIDSLQVGESVKTEDAKDYNAATQFASRARPKRFAFRKLPGEGWRVWRVE